MATYYENYRAYLKALRGDYTKLAKLDFLNPDGSTAFTVDNGANGTRRGALIQEGQISVNFQNGMRRTAQVTLSNLDGEYDYNVNHLWFGQNVRLSEGLILPDGTEFYITQGVFGIRDPNEVWRPGQKTAVLNLVDKWAYLDGSLFGNLDGIYEVPVGSNIFAVMASVLAFDRGNGMKVDDLDPVFTRYYNGKTQTLTDGTRAYLTETPYTMRVDSENGTYADILLGLNNMLVGVIGYDPTGRLRVEPSQDDLDDIDKEILWEFTPEEKQFLGATYTVLNSQTYNDIIVLGETQDDYAQPKGRATNTDPQSDLSIYGGLGLRTLRMSAAGYATDRQCQDLAEWVLKKNCILKKSVTIESGQIFHIQENRLVTIRRTDKPGAPIERHLVTGFTRPIAQTGAMTITATSVEDFAREQVDPPQNLLTFETVTPSSNNTCEVVDGNTLVLVTTTNAANRQATTDVQLEANTKYILTCSVEVTTGTASIRYKLGTSSSDVAAQTMVTLVSNFTTDKAVSATFTTGANAYTRFYFFNTGSTAQAGNVTYRNIWLLKVDEE